jgi:orotate phosphoribosyltransferase
MEKEKILEIFRNTEVMLEGHFLLTSGRHSDKYMQCAKLFQYPDISELFCKELAEKFNGKKIDLVAGPAIGGIIIAYETARQFKVKNVFSERENGVMVFRRGFEIPRGANVLVVEDVVTTGGSVREVIQLIADAGATVAGIGCIVDRSNGKVDFGCEFKAVLSMEVVSYEPEQCPICATGKPLIKPGSRKANKNI